MPDSTHPRKRPSPEFNAVTHQGAEHHLRSDWDVDVKAATDGQVLTYRASDRRWHPTTISATPAFSGARWGSGYYDRTGNDNWAGSYESSVTVFGNGPTMVWDTDNYTTGQLGSFKIPANGYYIAMAEFYFLDSGTDVEMYLGKVGSTYDYGVQSHTFGLQHFQMDSGIMKLATNDIVDLEVNNSVGFPVIGGLSLQVTKLEIYRLATY